MKSIYRRAVSGYAYLNQCQGRGCALSRNSIVPRRRTIIVIVAGRWSKPMPKSDKPLRSCNRLAAHMAQCLQAIGDCLE